MTTSTATRERILDSAMRLFGEHGFRGTSVAAIERAAGLTPGAGGLYHHFPSKDAVLSAGLERHLGKLGALRDIRRLFAGVGDLRVELRLIARYVLSELDAESALLTVLVSETRSRPELVQDAASTLVRSTYAEFADWLVGEWRIEPGRAGSLSAVALGSLLSHRLVRALIPTVPPGAAGSGTAELMPDDDGFVEAWVDLVARSVSA